VDDANLTPEPSLNPEFMAKPAEELLAYLNHHPTATRSTSLM
jgi:hypothetical protein